MEAEEEELNSEQATMIDEMVSIQGITIPKLHYEGLKDELREAKALISHITELLEAERSKNTLASPIDSLSTALQFIVGQECEIRIRSAR